MPLTALHNTLLPISAHYCISVHLTALHNTLLPFTTPYYPSVVLTDNHKPLQPFTTPTALQCPLLSFSAPYCHS
jgi:hypothetical protein